MSRSGPTVGWDGCRGGSVALTVNGTPTVAWNDCPFPTGALGLQAEFAVYEVRAFRFRPD